MEKIAKTILIGLQYYGREVTFSQILDEAKVSNSLEQQVKVANSLVAKGYIEMVTFRIPFEIRAELSPSGRQFAHSLTDSIDTN